MSEVTLSVGAVAAVTTLLGGLCAAVVALYFHGRTRERELTTSLVKAKDDEIERSQETTARLMTMLDRLIPAVEETSRQVQRLVTLIETWRPGRHE